VTLRASRYGFASRDGSLPRGLSDNETSESVGLFHDSEAAFHLQAGAWVVGVGRSYAANQQGLPDAKLGWFFFPEVQGGKGKASTSLAVFTDG
jgi:hypothetical protein